MFLFFYHNLNVLPCISPLLAGSKFLFFFLIFCPFSLGSRQILAIFFYRRCNIRFERINGLCCMDYSQIIWMRLIIVPFSVASFVGFSNERIFRRLGLKLNLVVHCRSFGKFGRLYK